MNINNDIFNFFQKYSNSIILKEKKWYNGHAYLPLYFYELRINENYSNIQIFYEYRLSEFLSSSIIDGGAFNDRHSVNIVAEFELENIVNTFDIIENNFFQKILTKHLFKVKTKNLKLKNYLLHNTRLINIFKNDDPEFSPSITTNLEEGIFRINFVFNTKYFDEKLLTNIIFFLKGFDRNLL